MRRAASDSVTLKFREVTSQTNGKHTSVIHDAPFTYDIYLMDNGAVQAHVTQGPEDPRVKALALGGALREQLESKIKDKVKSLFPNADVVLVSVGV